LLELSKDTTIKRIIGYKFPLNLSVAANSAEDKVLASIILTNHDVPVLSHALVKTKGGTDDTWLRQDWQDIVVKPLTGTGGHGVRRFHDARTALDWISTQPDDAWAVSPFIDIKREIRLVMLDGTLLLAYEKVPVLIGDLLMYNLGLGATPKDVTVDSTIEDIAKKTIDALGLRLGAVDIIELADGSHQILEVNDGVMMEHYARTSDTYEANVRRVYATIIDTMMA
jgi:glutathione synthase/RimK-type ligase-like ATP-grasp enzyme